MSWDIKVVEVTFFQAQCNVSGCRVYWHPHEKEEHAEQDVKTHREWHQMQWEKLEEAWENNTAIWNPLTKEWEIDNEPST